MRLPDKSSRLDLAALFLPQPDQGGFVITHDDPGVRATDEVSAIRCLPIANLPCSSVPEMMSADDSLR